jgi:lipopolysaccharide export system protein LptC
MRVNRSILYLIIVLLFVAVSALGYFYYQEQKTASGVDITVDDQGLSIQKK